jgi:hypothetical protein
MPKHLYAPPRGFPTLPRLDRLRPGCNLLGSLARCIRHLGLIAYRLTLEYAKTGLFLGLRPFFQPPHGVPDNLTLVRSVRGKRLTGEHIQSIPNVGLVPA